MVAAAWTVLARCRAGGGGSDNNGADSEAAAAGGALRAGEVTGEYSMPPICGPHPSFFEERQGGREMGTWTAALVVVSK